MSKAAMVNLGLQLAHEFAPKVRVNSIAPAVVKTKFAQALYEGREEEAAAAYPLVSSGFPRTSAEPPPSSPPSSPPGSPGRHSWSTEASS